MLIIKRKKKFIVVAAVLFSLFTVTGCQNKKQIQLLSDKIVELEKSNAELNSHANELTKSNEELNSEIAGLKKNNEDLNSQAADLKEDIEKLTESNEALKKENADLKKKLGGSEPAKPPTPSENPDKTAYLTFDDGPSDNTIKILDTLKANNIKATFFVTGNPARAEIYKRIISEGHTIGNHTYSHDYALLYKTIDGFYNDMKKLGDFLYEITGVMPEILRFPGGSNNRVSYKYGGADFMDRLTKQVRQSGIVYFDWNVDSTDASVTTQYKDKIISSVLNGAKNKKEAIILMHDSKAKKTTAEALPAIIKGLKDQGFKFAPLSSKVTPVQFK